MKKLMLLAIFSICVCGVSTSAAEVTTIVGSKVSKVTSEILKVSWQSVDDEGFSYIVQSSPSVTGPWETFSTERSAGNFTRRSIVITNDLRFYRVLQVGRGTHNTNVAITNLIPNGDLEVMENGTLPLGWAQGGYGSNTRIFNFPIEGPDGVGDRAVEVLVRDWVNGDAKWYFAEVPVNPSSYYAFKDSYRGTSPSIITIQVRDKTGRLSYFDIGSLPKSSEWTNSYSEFTTSANASALTIFHRLSSNGRLAIDNAFLYQVKSLPRVPLTEGMISFDFEDGWREPFVVATNVLGQAGFKATFYIISEAVGDWINGYVFIEDVFGMERLGHEVGAHTLTHPDLLRVTTEQMERELNLSRQYLLARGIKSVNTFSYPYGSYNRDLEGLVREAGFGVARTADEGINEKGTTDRYALQSIGMLSNTDIDHVRALIDKAKAEKGWLILLFHHIDNSGANLYTVTPGFFREVVNYVKEKSVKVVTASEGAKLMFAP